MIEMDELCYKYTRKNITLLFGFERKEIRTKNNRRMVLKELNLRKRLRLVSSKGMKMDHKSCVE